MKKVFISSLFILVPLFMKGQEEGTSVVEPTAPAATPNAETPTPAPQPERRQRTRERVPREVPALHVVCHPIPSLGVEDNVAPLVMYQMPVGQVLELLQRLSGRTLLLGAGIPDIRINFNSGNRISRLDAIFAIENLLAMHGVQLIQVDDRFVRAVPAANITRGGPTLLNELSPDLRGGQVYSRIFQLEYLSAQEAARLVGPLLSSGRSQSAVITLVRNNSLLVIDTLTNLQFIQQVLKDADEPGQNRVEVYAISLAHTPVSDAFRFITQLQRTSHQDIFRGTTFYQDNRTNQLIVSTNPAHIDLIRKILQEFDQDATPLTTSEIFQVKNANVASVYSILNNIIQSQRRIWNQRGFVDPDTVRSATRRQAAERGVVDELEEEFSEGPVIASTGDLLEGTDDVMMDGGMPQLQFSAYLSVFMDRNASQIIAYGTPKDLERVASLIEGLDKVSAPLTESEMLYLKHANSNDVARTITTLINIQRRAFSREGVESATRRGNEGEALSAELDGLKFSQFAIVVSERRSNSLLVYGTQSDLVHIRRLTEQLDQPTAPLTESKLFRFRYADANTASNAIARIIQNQRNSFAREGILDTERRRDEADASSSAEADQSNLVFSPYITLMPDRRANALLVYGTRQDMERVEELIAAIDVEAAPFTSSKVVYLQHSQASTVGGVLANLINQQRRSYSQQGLRSGAEANAASGSREENGPLVRDNTGTEFSPFATVVADQRTNALLLYGTENDIRSMSVIVERMDIPVDPLTRSEVFHLRYAQSTNLVGILNTIIRSQQQALRQVASASRDIRTPGANENTLLTGSSEPMQFSPYVTLVADRRSNTILGYGTASDLEQIRRLIEQTDIEVAPVTRSQVFQIQHGESNQVVQTLQTLISSQQRVREQESTLRRVFSRDQNEAQQGENADLTTDHLLEALLESGEGFQFSPYISLVSDQRSNSVVAYGTSFDLEQVADLIRRIDVVLPQVRIEVVIAEVALTGDMVSGLSAFGFNYRSPADPANPGIGDLGFNMNSPAFDGENAEAFSTSFTLNEFSLSTIFNVAQRDRNVRVLSAPTIVTTHNRQAQINVGQARPIVTGTITGAGSGSNLTTQSTVEYRDIGIELRVRPLIGTGSNIQMEIEQIVDTVVGTQTISDNVQPIIGTRRASSFISVKDQEVIVLGGLQSVDTTEIDGKVFLLGDLPFIGPLFRPRTEKQDVRELIIFIKPYIVESGGDNQRMTKTELEKTAVGREIEYFLREGRFPEQGKLHEINRERTALKQEEWPAASAPQRVWKLPEPDANAEADTTPAAENSSSTEQNSEAQETVTP